MLGVAALLLGAAGALDGLLAEGADAPGALGDFDGDPTGAAGDEGLPGAASPWVGAA